jgi:hypothetical protein
MVSKHIAPSIPQLRRLAVVVVLGCLAFVYAKAGTASPAAVRVVAPASLDLRASGASPFGQIIIRARTNRAAPAGSQLSTHPQIS